MRHDAQAPGSPRGVFTGARRYLPVALMAGLLVMSVRAWAVDPTSLEPVEPFEPGLITIQEEAQFDAYHPKEIETDTNLLYDFTKSWGAELTIPTELGSDQPKGLGQVRLRLKYNFNPDAEKGPLVALAGEVILPTEKMTAGTGFDMDLRFTLPIGAGDAQQKLHLTLKETYMSGLNDRPEWEWTDRERRYDGFPGNRRFSNEIVLGYSRLLNAATELRFDIDREQLDLHHEVANVVQVGVTREIGDSATIMLGAGVGIGHDSPDFRIRTGFEITFGGPDK